MEKFSIYEDIKKRTGGDIYIGVVGPVRCGKSTFITNFMQNFVLPNVKNKHTKERMIDELPQSAEGLTIMTTQPKFVPNQAVSVSVNNVNMRVRMIDSVGYLIGGALGYEENDKPRLVKTPWTESEIPFEEAAEIGTNKIMQEHSTIGIVMTSDGTVNEIPRSAYVDAEERVITEMKKTGKPFVLVINSQDPSSENIKTLKTGLSKKYNVPVVPLNAEKLSEENIEEIFAKILLEFPLKTIQISMPKYLQALPFDNQIISEIIAEVKRVSADVSKVGQVDKNLLLFENNENFEPIGVDNVSLGEGSVAIKINPKQELFYKVLSMQCGEEIKDDFYLVSFIKDLAYAKKQFAKLEEALIEVEQTGYGVVNPSVDDLCLDEPQIVKQGGRFGVKLKASAPSLHIMKVDVETEISPIVGSQQQSEEMAKYLTTELEENPEKLWQTNMFGRSLFSMVNDGIKSKIITMPNEARNKMRRTLTRIVNEGKGGVICILL